MSLLPVSAEEALDPASKVYARWTLHGTSHMLGMDVHDCGHASPEAYNKGVLAAGMVLTVEPGLYFQEDDLLVPEELRGKIFDPFFTTRAPNEGTGLGLSIAFDIVREHGGELELERSAEPGAHFAVRLPAVR